MFFIVENSEETTFEFLQNAATFVWSRLNIKNRNTKNFKFIRWRWIFKVCDKKMVCYQWSE